MHRSQPGARHGSAPRVLSLLAQRSLGLARRLPRIKQDLSAVIKSDLQPIFCHPNPSKPMCCHAKSLLGVPDPYRVKPSSASPFDDLLIKSYILVGLVMVVTGKVHLNAALTEQLFELTPDKP